MLLIDALQVLAALVHVREPEEAKKVAGRVIAMADVSELWTIARCAAILDTDPPNVAYPKLDRLAQSLTDEHRRELVTFVAEHTGHRPRVTTPPVHEPRFVLSVDYDTRPGYDQHDAQPGGLVVYPDGYEEQRQHHKADTLTRLTRNLRDSVRQLPPHVRTALRDVARATRPECRYRRPYGEDDLYDTSVVDKYMATRLNIEDHSTDGHGMSTIFDVDDDKHRRLIAPRVMSARIAEIRRDMKARTTAADALAEATAYDDATDQATDQPAKANPVPDAEDSPSRRNTEVQDPDDGPHAFVPGFEVDYAKAAQHPIRTTPCVWCFSERSTYDTRHMPYLSRHDDGLCGECRDKDRPGLPKPPAATVRTVAYLDPQARREAAHAAAILAPCAAVADHLPYGAALVWMRAYYTLVADTGDAWTVCQGVKRWQRAQQAERPQPPTPPAAPALPAAPVPALAAA